MAKIRISKLQESVLRLIASGGKLQTTYGKKKDSKKCCIILDGKEIPVSTFTVDAFVDRGLIGKKQDIYPIRYWALTSRGRKRAGKDEL